MAYSNEHHISDLIEQIYRRNDMTAAVDAGRVKMAYKAVVGELIEKLTGTLRYSEGILYVTILSAALRHELRFRERGLVDKINDYIGHNAVKKIVFE